MKKGLVSTPRGVEVDCEGSHLDHMQIENVPRIRYNYEERQPAVEVRAPDTSRSSEWSIWLPYNQAGYLKYSTSRSLNFTMSGVVHSIMSSLNMCRRRKSRGLAMRMVFMALGELLSSLCFKPWLRPVDNLYDIKERRFSILEVNAHGFLFVPLILSPTAMAPKRECTSPSPSGQNRPHTRRASKEESRAAQAANYFKTKVPLEIQADIDKVEKLVWEESEQGIPETDFNELANWIKDPGSTYGRLTLYQRAISYFWAAKCISARNAMAQRPSTPKALAPAPLWNHHFNDARLMHKKIDIIAGKLGIQFIAPEAFLLPPACPRAAKVPDPQASNAQVP